MRITLFKSLQSKIFVLFIFLLLLVQLMSFYSTYKTNQKSESIQLNNHLFTAKKVFETQYTSRSYYLTAFAETAAKDYGLKSVFKDDPKSFLIALNNHRQRINADFAIAINDTGHITAQLISYFNDKNQSKIKQGAEKGKLFKYPNWLDNSKLSRLYMLDNSVFQLSLAPLKSGGRVIGWVGFGYVVDDNLANELAELTNVNISFLLSAQNNDKKLLASSRQQSSSAFEAINSERYITSNIKLGSLDNAQLNALMFKSKADLLKIIVTDWWQLLVFFLVTLLLSLSGAYAISASITKPIRLLITQVKSIANGNYNETVTISDSQELNLLANEFNSMKESVVIREKTITHRVYHEPLTDLPNRNYLLKSLVARTSSNQNYIVIQLNIKRIKEVNDTLGHKVGDEVIKEVAHRLMQSDIKGEVFHIGSDEFVLLCNEQEITRLIANLKSKLEPLYEHDNYTLHLQYSLGIALFPEHKGEDVAEILQKTDVALQYAKKQNMFYQIYDRQFDFNTVERLYLINSLKTAIEESQLVLYYQPKLSMETMKISHAEALVRWQHPINGLIPPDSFISIAEQTGQMDALTRWVTKQAITEYLNWQKMGINIKIAINISAENLKDKSYSDFIIALKKDNKIADQEITLEVTEDAVLSDPKQATEILTYLKSNGFKLSIDDYGTGYSSLSQLKQLPVQELKIDKSFVQELMQNKDDQIIVRSTIELAHNMGLTVVAEGIEDERTLSWLKQHNCELAQGYFISRPVDATLFTKWLLASAYFDKGLDHE